MILGHQLIDSRALGAVIVRFPQAANWYSPGSYANMPNLRLWSIPNVYFCGDFVCSKHRSWFQEKAYVMGVEAANSILGWKNGTGIMPLSPNESAAKTMLVLGDASWKQIQLNPYHIS
jgi:uncharacterized protein with NAD-binding domain and iron-sulfur cluster